MSGAVPKLRFPEFNEDWNKKTLGELGYFKSGAGFPNDEQGGVTGVPFYKVSDMNLPGNEEFMTTANNHVSQEQVARLKLKPIKNRALIFAKVGAAIFLERKREAVNFLIDNNMMAFIPRDNLEEEYLRHLFSIITLSKYAQVGSLPSYNGSDLATIKLFLPTSQEQRKIAAFLQAIDAKLTALREKADALRRFKTGLMQKLFSQELRFTREDGSDFPEWEERKLGDIASFYKGKAVSKADIIEGGATLCIRYGEIYTLYSERIKDVVSATDLSPDSLFLSEAGDIIIPASGEDRLDMARACCVTMAGVALGGDINVLRSPIRGDFLAYYLNNARKKDIAMLGQGNSVVHLYPVHLRTLTVEVPHPDEQAKIADALMALDEKVEAVTDQITHMETFKKGLLQKMFV